MLSLSTMRTFILSLVLDCSLSAFAQTATDPNLGTRLVRDNSTGAFTLSWWSRSGDNYLVEWSHDLVTWDYVPIPAIDLTLPPGPDGVQAMAVVSPTMPLFLRIDHFDPDHVAGVDDKDGDGLPDKWEQFYFGVLSQDGSGDANHDGLLDRDAFRYGLDPRGEDESGNPAMVEQFEYDPRGWLIGYAAPQGASADYSLDDEGNLLGAY